MVTLINSPKYSILRLVLTRRCNLNCRYCFVDKAQVNDMEFKTAKNAINLFLKTSKENKSLTFFGGEPFLKFDLMKRITKYYNQKVKGKNKHIYMPTNGTICNKEVISFIKDNNIKISISIDGPEEIHYCNRIEAKKNIDYLKISSNIDNLNAKRINSVITPLTVNTLLKTFLFLDKIKVNEISIDTARNVKWEKETLKKYKKEISKIANYCINNIWPNYSKKISPFHEYFTSFLLDKKQVHKTCSIHEIMMTVSPEGEIIPCVDFLRYNEKELKKYSAGNVNKNNFNFNKIDEIMSFSIMDKCNKGERKCSHIRDNLICALKDYNNKPFGKNQIILNSFIDEINYWTAKQAYEIMKDNNIFIKKLKKSTFEDENGKKEA